MLGTRDVAVPDAGDAIVVTGLKIGLQTEQWNPYDTARSLPVLHPAASTVMNETGVGDTPLVDRKPATPASQAGLDSTFALVERVKGGDREALDRLFTRFMPSLRRWASGRLPRWSRDLMDTDDLVQETVIRAVKRIDHFESRHEGALQAYLRQAIVNRIRDEVRRTQAGADCDRAGRQRQRSQRVAARNCDRRRGAGTLRSGAGAAAAGGARSDRGARRDGRQLSGSRASARQTVGRCGAYGGEPGAAPSRRGDESWGILTRRRCCRSRNRSPTARRSIGPPSRRAPAASDQAVIRQLRILSDLSRAAPQPAGHSGRGASRTTARRGACHRHLGAPGADRAPRRRYVRRGVSRVGSPPRTGGGAETAAGGRAGRRSARIADRPRRTPARAGAPSQRRSPSTASRRTMSASGCGWSSSRGVTLEQQLAPTAR